MDATFLSSPIFTWVIIPILIFFARIIDVSIGTMRIILVSKGRKLLPPILGFFEIIVWLLAIGHVMQNLTNIVCIIAYGAGFAMGNFVGVLIEEKLAVGLQIVRLITPNSLDILPMALRDEGYGATVIEAKGGKGKVNIIFSIVSRKDVSTYLLLAREIDPDIFVSVQDIRTARSGFFPSRSSMQKWRRVTKKK